MSTHAWIGKKEKDGSVKSIYCHHDGSPDGVGDMLVNNYQDENKVDKLLSLGDISFLSESIECPPGHSYETPKKGYTVFYGRDRGESNTSADKYPDEKSFRSAARSVSISYVYIYKDGKWTN